MSSGVKPAKAPEGIKDYSVTVTSVERLSSDIYALRFNSPELAKAKPGQFINVSGWDHSEGPLLRRPFAIAEVNGDEVSMMFRVIGHGTKFLSGMKPGDPLKVLGPLGNSFPLPENNEAAVLLAGGIGFASVLLLTQFIKPEKIAFLAGWKNADEAVYPKQIAEQGARVHTSTDDGSAGFKGNAVQMLEHLGEKLDINRDNAIIYACGPHVMYRPLQELVKKKNWRCYVALEEYMACGYGICQGCVCKAKDPEGNIWHPRVCVEGPIFNLMDIVL